MHVRVSARHATVSDRDRSLISDKIDRLAKYLPGMERAEVHFTEERNPRIADKEICEVTLEGHGHHVRAKASGPDALTAVDLAVEKLENKLHKLKTKLAPKPRHRAAQRATKLVSSAPVDDSAESELVMSNGSRPVTTVAEPRTGGAALEQLGEQSDPLGDQLSNDTGVVEYEIVRSKKVEKLALTVQEAALRMDLVSHDFYFFTNVETGRAAVVYRRRDGGVGIIDELEG